MVINGTKHVKNKVAVKKKLILSGIVIIAVMLILMVVGIIAGASHSVFPNVVIEDTDVGGMTYEKAYSAIIENGYSSGNYSATVNLFGNVSISVTSEETGIRLTPEEAAQYAVDYGKGGFCIKNAVIYIKCLLLGSTLTPGGSEKYIDSDYLSGKVSEAVAQANEKMIGMEYSVEGDYISLVKGSESASIDEGKVYDMIVDELLTGTSQTETYKLENDNNSNIDLQALYDAVYKDPASAGYDSATDTLTEDSVGLSFDLNIAEKLVDEASTGDVIEIPLIKTEPKVTKEQLEEVLFRDVLSEKSTSLSGSSNARINNITLAAEAVNGTVLNPGDEFSFNDVVGQRTAEKGYQGAGAYAGGQSVTEIGGGICQVSSTIYYCVLYSNLNVVERYNHMFTVGYLPLGLDATVSWGGPEFRFSNNTDYPIKIEAYVSSGKLTVRLYGTKTDDTYVQMQSVTVSVIDYDTIEKPDDTLAAGETSVDTSGHTGYVVDTYKYIYDGDGTLIEKIYVDRSIYDKQDRVVLVSPADADTAETTTGTDTTTSVTDAATSTETQTTTG